ncbi:FecR family protein [Muriicola sp. Z0-33]|uniref:FecR family protein n=1 Tax=Muriicola sp. Z0-33 TaxID=2816957 RepID=UPI0022370E6B|nr:FecR family protein [Muriicola sp. Z0-33]MCW5516829.1 FecR family protein [Muriicola sp. Z0-33]
MKENYLAKWLNNELTEAELAEFEKTAEYATYKKILDVSADLEPPKFDIEKALDDLRNNRPEKEVKVIRLSPMKKVMRLAAAVAAIVAVAYFYINSLDITVTTQYAQQTEVILPDASEIILNAASEISYSEKRWDKDRNVKLEGEAFFKVAKGKRFTVATENGLVTVLGTQFNVENRKDFFEVTCYEGLVSVAYNGTETKLPAGTSFIVINGEIQHPETPNSSVPSWMNNESSFKSIPLAFVLDEFERQFNIEVETKNIDLDQLFTGTFSNTNVNLALQSISTPSHIKFNLEENKVLIYAENAP